jgi:hypothetical protein
MEGMPKIGLITGFPPVMITTAASWAIYGAVKEWFNTPNRASAEEIVPVILRLVLPILQAANPVDSPYSTPVAQNMQQVLNYSSNSVSVVLTVDCW